MECQYPRSAILQLALSVLDMGDKLGDGASGDVFAASLEGQAVAVKVRAHFPSQSRVIGCLNESLDSSDQR